MEQQMHQFFHSVVQAHHGSDPRNLIWRNLHLNRAARILAKKVKSKL